MKERQGLFLIYGTYEGENKSEFLEPSFPLYKFALSEESTDKRAEEKGREGE